MQHSAGDSRPLLVLICLAVCGCTSQGITTLPDPLEAGWLGEKVCENLHEDTQSRVLRCEFPPNVGHERHVHAPHTGYVLAGGRMQITDASGVREVTTTTGATWTSAGGKWHEVLNVGTDATSYLIIEIK